MDCASTNQFIFDFVYFYVPVIDHETVTFCFFISKTDLCRIWLHDSILLLFDYTINQQRRFTFLNDFWIRTNSDWSFVVFFIFVIFKFTIWIEFKESNLFISVPVLFAQITFPCTVIAFDRWSFILVQIYSVKLNVTNSWMLSCNQLWQLLIFLLWNLIKINSLEKRMLLQNLDWLEVMT